MMFRTTFMAKAAVWEFLKCLYYRNDKFSENGNVLPFFIKVFNDKLEK